MFFNEDHLRVTKTKTMDGVNPAYDSQNRPIKKVVHLPLTSKKFVEENNTRLPNQLKMDIQVITHVPAYAPPEPDLKAIQMEAMQKRIDELELQNKTLSEVKDKPVKNDKS